MKKLFRSSLLVSLLMMTPALAHPLMSVQGNANVVGSWDMTVESPQGQRTVLLVIKQEADKLTGSVKSPRGEHPLESVAIKGNDISFSFKYPIEGQEAVLSYKGKVEKDSMKGDADFGGIATGTWSAVPHKEESAGSVSAATPATTSTPSIGSAGVSNISGDWEFTLTSQMGTFTPVITFKQDGENLSGTYKGRIGEAPITGTLKNGEIKFSFKVNFQGQDHDVTYTGKVEGKDSMKGKSKIGDFGEADWTAKRKQ